MYRSLLGDEIWLHKPYSWGQAWVDLIANAKYQDEYETSRNRSFKVKRGQLLTSISKLSERWGWHKKSVINYLAVLKRKKKIRVKQDNYGSLITIVNYDKYQNSGSLENRNTGSLGTPQKEHFPIIKERKENSVPFGTENTQVFDNEYLEEDGWYDP
jgi:hypothetical protein